MGSGRWNSATYTTLRSTRTATAHSLGVAPMSVDFAYSQEAELTKKIHPNLDPLRINRKPAGILESRDSAEHPESNAVMVCFDVTGSNYHNAVAAQLKLPNLMELAHKYLSDPQVAVAANDDYNVVGANCIQISDYESDIRIDEHIRNVWLVGKGGSNSGESYDLLMYLAARKTALDCFERRNRKGYFFMYADEPIFDHVSAPQVQAVFGDTIPADIPIETMIEDLKRTYYPFVFWPSNSPLTDSRRQYVRLFGEESVFTLQHPDLICEQIGAIIGLNEDRVTQDGLAADLESVGVGESDLARIAGSVRTFRRRITLP
jgi:hypothetical protein